MIFLLKICNYPCFGMILHFQYIIYYNYITDYDKIKINIKLKGKFNMKFALYFGNRGFMPVVTAGSVVSD